MTHQIDITDKTWPKEIFDILLQDKTTGENITWATEDYLHLGENYAPQKPITHNL